MVEYGEGQKHYVVGFLASMHGVDLPTWVYTPRQTSLVGRIGINYAIIQHYAQLMVRFKASL